MAQVILGGAAGGVRNRFREVKTHVYAKRAVGDDWTYLPYLTCTRCEVSAAPGVGTATLEWTFGSVQRAELKAYALYAPYLLNRAYVKVEVSNGFASTPIWYGVVESEQVRPFGHVGIATGKQVFTAYELSHLLDRCAVVGSYVYGTPVRFIDETLVFNGEQSGRTELYPNRYNAYFGGGNGAGLWTAWQVLDYVFDNFVNGQYGITFVGHGTAQAALDTTWERWDLRGMTPKQILDTIVDRKKGLGWRVACEDDLSTVYIHVFSQLAESVAVGEFGYIPANENQTDLQFAGYRDVEPTYHFGELTHYDLVRIIGGPIYTTATFSFVDGTLEENWETSAEMDYAAGSAKEGASAYEHDQRRHEADLSAVYQRFKVPDAWDGYVGDGEGGALVNALPVCGLDGVLYPDVQAAGFRPGKRFERELPWDVATGDVAWTEANRELLMAFVSYLDPNAEDPETAAEIWSRVEDLTQLDMGGARVTPQDTDMGVELGYVINHFFGLNHWDEGSAEPSNYTARVDYQTLAVTARFKTDELLKMVARVPSVEWSETGKVKDIFLPEATVEYVAPGTISGVVDGEPVRTMPDTLRDDAYRLQRVLALAVAFFGLVRCTLSFEAKKVSLAYGVGTLVRNTVGPEGVTGVGTVVTRQEWQFASGGQRTSWQTGYEEIDFGRAGRGN